MRSEHLGEVAYEQTKVDCNVLVEEKQRSQQVSEYMYQNTRRVSGKTRRGIET